MPNRIFGIVGPIASGKGTVVSIMKEAGYSSYSLSDRIREEIASRGLESTRKNLNIVSNELRQSFGPDVLARRTARLIERDNRECVVVDSIRNPHEIEYLKSKFEITIIGIDADQKKRFELFMSRGKNNSGIENWKEFKDLDDKESTQDDPKKQQVKRSLEIADTVINNNGTLEELRKKVEQILGS